MKLSDCNTKEKVKFVHSHSREIIVNVLKFKEEGAQRDLFTLKLRSFKKDVQRRRSSLRAVSGIKTGETKGEEGR
jgi:hypothetical protein